MWATSRNSTPHPTPGSLGWRLSSPEQREVLEDRRGLLFLAAPWVLPGAVGPGDGSLSQAPAPRAPAPPQPRRRGPRHCSMKSAFAEVAESVRVGPRSGFSVPGSIGYLGAHRALAPPPTSQTEISPARGCGLAKVVGKTRPCGRPLFSRVQLWPLVRPTYHAGAAPHPLRAAVSSHGFEPSLQGARPAETASRAGAARRQTPGKRGRAPEQDWRGRDALGSARLPAPEAEGKPGLTHPRAASPEPGRAPGCGGRGRGATPARRQAT